MHDSIPQTSLLAVHCFWFPRCSTILHGFDPDELRAAMEAHYSERHTADINRIVVTN